MTHIASIFGAVHGELLKFLYRCWNVLGSELNRTLGGYYRLALNAIKLIPSKCHQITQNFWRWFLYASLLIWGLCHLLRRSSCRWERNGKEWARRGLTDCSVQHLLHLKYERESVDYRKSCFYCLCTGWGDILVEEEVCVERTTRQVLCETKPISAITGAIIIGVFAGNKT